MFFATAGSHLILSDIIYTKEGVMVFMASLGMDYFFNCEYRSAGEFKCSRPPQGHLGTKDRLKAAPLVSREHCTRAHQPFPLSLGSRPTNAKYRVEATPCLKSQGRKKGYASPLSITNPISHLELHRTTGPSTSFCQGLPWHNPGYIIKDLGS